MEGNLWKMLQIGTTSRICSLLLALEECRWYSRTLLLVLQFYSNDGHPKHLVNSLEVSLSLFWQHFSWGFWCFYALILMQKYGPCRQYSNTDSVLMIENRTTAISMGHWDTAYVACIYNDYSWLWVDASCNDLRCSIIPINYAEERATSLPFVSVSRLGSLCLVDFIQCMTAGIVIKRIDSGLLCGTEFQTLKLNVPFERESLVATTINF